MDFNLLAAQRYSVRSFSSRPIEPEKLDMVVRAAGLAPTACNNQPQRLFLINSKEGMEKLTKGSARTFGAPAVLLLCYDSRVSWKRSFDGVDMGPVDAAIVGTHVMLQAADLGLGTTWVGYFNPEVISAEFQLPENIVPVALFPMGYPSDDCRPGEMHTQRHGLNVPQL